MEKSKIYIIAISLITVVLYSCKDDTKYMLTKINADGSCYREFMEVGDSAFMVGDTTQNNPFPFNLDSNWEITWKYKNDSTHTNWPLKDWKTDTTDKESSIHVYARRKFTTVIDLNNVNFYERESWKEIHPNIEFRKKFHWFYTYYFFSEKYPKLLPFNHSPISEYMSEKDVKLWFQGDEGVLKGMNGLEIYEYLSEVEKGYNKWIDRNFFEEEYSLVLELSHLLNDDMLTKEFLKSKKDSIYNLHKYELLENDVLEAMDEIFQTDQFKTILGNTPEFEEYNEYTELLLNQYGFNMEYRLLMPGKFIHTNSSINKGDTLLWKLDAYRLTANDYEIFAESRKANIWAFVVSAMLVLGVILSYLISFRGKG